MVNFGANIKSFVPEGTADALVAGNVLIAGTADNSVVIGTAAATTFVGVAVRGEEQPDAQGARSIAVQTSGFANVVASAAITKGDLLEIATGGKVATYSDTATYVQNERNAIIGRAMEAATDDGDVIEMKILN